MNTDNIGKYITAFMVCIGCIATPAFIFVAIIAIILCNTNFTDIKEQKEYKETTLKPLQKTYGKNYKENDNYYAHLELAKREYYYHNQNNRAYKQYLGTEYFQ